MPSWYQHVGKCQSSGTFEWGFRQVTRQSGWKAYMSHFSPSLSLVSRSSLQYLAKIQFANVRWEILLINRTWLLKNRCGVGNKCHFRWIHKSQINKATAPHISVGRHHIARCVSAPPTRQTHGPTALPQRAERQDSRCNAIVLFLQSLNLPHLHRSSQHRGTAGKLSEGSF